MYVVYIRTRNVCENVFLSKRKNIFKNYNNTIEVLLPHLQSLHILLRFVQLKASVIFNN